MTRKKFISELEEKAEYFTDENYHTEASFLYDVIAKVNKADEKDWKDAVISSVLTFSI